MITESISIVLIVLIIIFMLIRTKHIDYALSVLPTLIIPSGHILVGFALFAMRDIYAPLRPGMVFAFADTVLLAVTCALFALFSHKIKNKRTRNVYVWTMIGYSVILTWAFIHQTISPMLL